jgi:hypothetical protein
MTWTLAGETDLPERWGDARSDALRCACSNGWEGGYSLGSAFDHKPARWPQCFPDGADGESACTVVILKQMADR